MKKIFLFGLIFFLAACNPVPEKIDIEAEKQAIKTTIENHLIARNALDYDAYIDLWLDDPSSFISYSGKDGYTLMSLEEWKTTGKEDFTKMKQDQIDDGYSVNIEPFDIEIRVNKETAWAKFNNRWTKTYEENDMIEDLGETFIILSMEKAEGEWKISFLSAVLLHSYTSNEE